MPQIPVNLDSAIATLKEETPSSTARTNARRLLTDVRPTRLLFPRLALAAVVASAAVAIVLWPRPTLSAPWSVAAKQTANVWASHRVERNAQGVVVMEIWQEGDKLAMTAMDGKTGRPLIEMRRNDQAYFDYFNFHQENSKDRNPNAAPAAVRGTNKPHGRSYDVANFDLVKSLLSDKNVEVLEQRNITTPDGDRIFYKLHSKLAGNTLGVYAEPQTGRIRKIVSTPSGTVATIEYPKRIDPKIFDVNVPVPKGTITFDIDVEMEQARKTISRGLGSKAGVTLRLVAMDAQGSLWVLWTGAPPAGTLVRPFKVDGAKLGKPFGIPAFTTNWPHARVSLPAPSIGLRLGGMARPMLTKAPSTLNISIPTPKGYVDFSGVPYQRINMIYDLSEPLGLTKPTFKGARR